MSPESADDGVARTASNPWEAREEVGWLRAFLATLRGLVVAPRELFAGTTPSASLAGALFFGATASFLGQALEMGLLAIVGPFLPEALRADFLGPLALDVDVDQLPWLPISLVSFLGCQAAILGLPLIGISVVLIILYWTTMSHFGLLLLGGNRAGLRATFVVTCYASAAALAQVIPVIGDLVYIVGQVTLMTIGLEVIHQTNRARALLATLFPLVLLAAAGTVGFLLFSSAI